MGFNQHKPVLEERTPQKRSRVRIRGGLLLLAHALLDERHENSFLLFCLLRSFCDLSACVFLVFHSLDHADGHRLPHVTHGKAT